VDESEEARMAVAPVTTAPPTRPHRVPFLYRKTGIWAVRATTAVIIFGSWQLYARHMSRALNAPPSEIVVAMYHQVFRDHTVWAPLGSSMEALGLGYVIALALGLPIGIAMGRWRAFENVLDPYVSFLYALPHVAFVSLMIIWLGFELKFRLAYVVFSAIFPVIVNTMTGVKNVDVELTDVGRSFCANERQILRRIVLPAAAPYMVAGARQAFSAAWVGVIVAEVLSTQTGLGGLINKYGNFFKMADMFVPILFIMLIAVIIQIATDFLQQRLTPWNNSTSN
jgi:ABC-type nitrate/sulfonate/bicarbonate transport system permease component